MVRQFLLLAGIAVGASAFAGVHQSVSSTRTADQVVRFDGSIRDLAVAKDAKLNKVPSDAPSKQKAPGAQVAWKRPAGQFWGTGMATNGNLYYLTPLLIRPWVDYTFENISTGVSGDPTWSVQVLQNPQTGEYATETFNTKDAVMSYLRYERCPAPRLSYKNQLTYPTKFDGEKEVDSPYNLLNIYANDVFAVDPVSTMLVSSHYWGMMTREPQKSPVTYIHGLKEYPGMELDGGMWFGTNNAGLNALATRFEKPDSPYLLNAVHWFYMSSGAIPENIPMRAYVFKTVDPACQYESGAIGVELGDLIAVSDSFIPASATESEGTVMFEFKEKNPVTGAETSVSLEIEDDITVVVTGFNADLGNGEYVTSLATTDNIDEGYGNLGFVGQIEISEDGGLSYGLVSLGYYFDELGLSNTVAGVLADVSYPWLFPYFVEQPDDVLLPNSGNTTEEVQGLQYQLVLETTSMTDDMEVTFNGEDECDWLEITDVYDEMEGDKDNAYFTGLSILQFDAAPNPDDISRTCVVNISIPAASYEITFRQGSDNNAVEVVGVESKPVYYDLNGRRVVNPEKGVYVKKSGNKTEKVIL